MRTLGKLACALVLVAFLLGGGLSDGGAGPAAALETKVAAAPEAVAFQKDKGDRRIHRLCKELIAVEKQAKKALREEAKEGDKRDVKHLRAIVKHLEEAVKECKRAERD